MTAEIITIGNELMIGQVVDSNSAWIAAELNKIGIEVINITSVPDVKAAIQNALQVSEGRSDVVLVTGGLGPTTDDITKDVIADYFNTQLVFHHDTYEHIVKMMSGRGIPVSDHHKKQAELPENCTVVKNKIGSAAGMWFNRGEAVFVFMPGVPFEMKDMMKRYIIPELSKKISNRKIFHKTVRTVGIGETDLSELITDWEQNLPESVQLGYLPQPGIVHLRLSTSESEELLCELIQKLKMIIPAYIFSTNEETLEQVVANLLIDNQKTISTAESCTGGYIAHLITSIPGSSIWYKGSVIPYSDSAKEKLLNVRLSSLIEGGAVSEMVVKEMAEGVRGKFETDYAISTSGIAGPDGGTPEKPVGTVWIALATPQKTIAEKFQFGNHRFRNIRRTAIMALDMVRKEIIR
ncbi:MAG: competence/damage-inducible protein A [Bacteroidales bacterium]|nr:competence/damage-inducible protein A [Bacteroidales bacterium]